MYSTIHSCGPYPSEPATVVESADRLLIQQVQFPIQLTGRPHTIDWGLLLVNLFTERSGRCTMAALLAAMGHPGEGGWPRPLGTARRAAQRAWRSPKTEQRPTGGLATILNPNFSLPAHFSCPPRLGRAAPTLHRAQQAVRSGRCVFGLSICPSVRLAVWFWLFAGGRAEIEGASEVVVGVFSRSPRSRRRTTRC